MLSVISPAPPKPETVRSWPLRSMTAPEATSMDSKPVQTSSAASA